MAKQREKKYIHVDTLEELFAHPSFYNCTWKVRERSLLALIEKQKQSSVSFHAKGEPDYRMYYNASVHYCGIATIEMLVDLYDNLTGMNVKLRPYTLDFAAFKNDIVQFSAMSDIIWNYNLHESIACQHLSEIYHSI